MILHTRKIQEVNEKTLYVETAEEYTDKKWMGRILNEEATVIG